MNVFASPPRATPLKSAATDVTALLCEPLSSRTLVQPFTFHTRTTPSAVPPSAKEPSAEKAHAVYAVVASPFPPLGAANDLTAPLGLRRSSRCNSPSLPAVSMW